MATEAIRRALGLGPRPDLRAAALLHDIGKLVLLRAYGRYELIWDMRASADDRLALETSELGIDHQITVMNISVAALMTTRWIAKRLSAPPGVDNIVIPGLCEGEVDTLQQATGLPVRKGPADVRALPEWYGREAVRAQLGPRDVRVFAEINDVQSLSREQVIDRAQGYHADGADVIDLGLSLDRPWLDEGPPTIAALRERGLSLSIDTLDPEHIRMADHAGVDYVLSLTPETIDLAEDLRATPQGERLMQTKWASGHSSSPSWPIPAWCSTALPRLTQ